MTLENKRIMVFAENIYQEMELWYPYYRLQEARATVHVVGSGSSDHYQSKHGYGVQVDYHAGSVKADDYHGVVIPGGYAPDIMRTNNAMVHLVRDIYKNGGVVAAICHAGWMLVSAGILQGKNATAYHAIKDDMINAGANFTDEAVVQDGNLITSRKPDDLPIFCRTIIGALQST